MLEEVELFVAGLDGEVIAVGGLVCAFGAERWIGEHDVVTRTTVGFVNSVAEVDVRLDAVEEKVHQGEPAGARDEVLAKVGLLI